MAYLKEFAHASKINVRQFFDKFPSAEACLEIKR
jgi:hypothetical protein